MIFPLPFPYDYLLLPIDWKDNPFDFCYSNSVFPGKFIHIGISLNQFLDEVDVSFFIFVKFWFKLRLYLLNFPKALLQ